MSFRFETLIEICEIDYDYTGLGAWQLQCTFYKSSYFRDGGVFHVKPLSSFCGLGLGVRFGQKYYCESLCYGCVCGHLENEEEHYSHVQMKSFGNMLHFSECCSLTVIDPSEND